MLSSSVELSHSSTLAASPFSEGLLQLIPSPFTLQKKLVSPFLLLPSQLFPGPVLILFTYLFLRYFTFLPWEHLFKARLSSTLAFMAFPSTSALCCSPSVLILLNFSFCLHLSSTRNSFFYLRFLLFITITAGNQPLPPPLCSVETNRPCTPVKHGSTLFPTQHWQREA